MHEYNWCGDSFHSLLVFLFSLYFEKINVFKQSWLWMAFWMINKRVYTLFLVKKIMDCVNFILLKKCICFLRNTSFQKLLSFSIIVWQAKWKKLVGLLTDNFDFLVVGFSFSMEFEMSSVTNLVTLLRFLCHELVFYNSETTSLPLTFMRQW